MSTYDAEIKGAISVIPNNNVRIALRKVIDLIRAVCDASYVSTIGITPFTGTINATTHPIITVENGVITGSAAA